MCYLLGKALKSFFVVFHIFLPSATSISIVSDRGCSTSLGSGVKMMKSKAVADAS